MAELLSARVKQNRPYRRLEGIFLGKFPPAKPDCSPGLEHLKGLSQLKRLGLTGTNVTDAGVEKLRQALPKCKIKR
jgi:hypothetical protein